MYGSLARHLKGKVALAICSAKDTDLVKQFDVSKMPELIAFTKGDTLARKQKYSGKLVFKQMEDFLLHFVHL